MSRPKQDIIKNDEFRIRIEPEFKKKYFLSCKKRKTTPSKEIREFVLNKIEK